jgi:hypothetical protein
MSQNQNQFSKINQRKIKENQRKSKKKGQIKDN